MAKSFLGIEIGNRDLKIVEFKNGKVLNFIEEELPLNMVKNNEIVAFDGMSDYLKQVIKEHHIKGKKVCFVVPDEAVYTRRLNLPLMTINQLKVNLPYEFRDFIPEEKEAYIFDYKVVDFYETEDGARMMDLLAVAVSKKLMDLYAGMFKHAGLKLIEAAPKFLALGELMGFINEEFNEKDFAILDLGYGSTRLSIYEKGIFDLTRNIETGVTHISDIAADLLNVDRTVAPVYLLENVDNVQQRPEVNDICVEIAISAMRAMNYYTYQKRDNTLEYVYLFGSGIEVAPLVDEIVRHVPLKAMYLKDLSDDALVSEALGNGPAALGIVCRK